LVHSAGRDGLQARALRHAAGADPDVPHFSDSVLYVAADGLFQEHSVRARGMRADRWGEPAPDPGEDHSAPGDTRAHFRRHLRLQDLMERINLSPEVRILFRS